MTLLLSSAAIEARRAAVNGGLRALADSLAADLSPFLGAAPFVPEEKARLSRAGGRCPDDGATLDFDPRSPRAHLCSRCGRVYDDDAHYRAWIYWYQLWLAERAVHAAALHLLRREPGCAAFADAVLGRYADLYLRYPNRDNVLGPTRLFFSTYLESIWLLQLAVALDLREQAGDCAPSLSGAVRERIVAPSAALIASYDEGTSNRQVWNDAALLAAARLTDDTRLGERALRGPSGIVALLENALLADGTWYEGDNYHQFAHRGLWYGVTLAAAGGKQLPAPLLARFDAGFAAPFVTALPDFTFPSRRDSQYAVSLRQWRFAEMAELGLARRDDDRLVGALHTMYVDVGDTPRRDTGRRTAAAEAERNAAPSALTRADLGWRSLLFARETLPPLHATAPRSTLLDAQGLAVLRRDSGRVYAALDYGRSGGGHGHPDRLNVLLMDGPTRWLDDVGTGSYVERSLHWYRSTLAHNAPLVDGRSQLRTDGVLLAWDERGGAGWADASAEIAPGVTGRRAVVAMPDYVVDDLVWRASRDVALELPLHVNGEVDGDPRWEPTELTGGGGLEDGFDFVASAEILARARAAVRLRAEQCDSRADVWSFATPDAWWWRAVAPGPPGSASRRFHAARQRGTAGRVTTVWSWRGAVRDARAEGDRVVVELADGSRHEHARVGDGWHVTLYSGGASSSIALAGARPRLTPERPTADDEPPVSRAAARGTIPRLPSELLLAPRPLRGALVLPLGEAHYRRSEQSWREAGAPSAEVALVASGDRLVVEIRVASSALLFAPADALNEMDNEHPDVNGDGVQLYVAAAPDAPPTGWRLVPEWPEGVVRVSPIAGLGGGARPAAEWHRLGAGYLVRCVVPLGADLVASGVVRLDVVVNETAPGRERRRGQLVLSGGAGEWVYLRGDRQPAERLLTFALAPAATTVP